MEACAKARPVLTGRAAETVDAVVARLAEEALRVAVGGRVNAGKSTLVNALLGQSLAATDATECTTVVTWFRYHHHNRVEVTPRTGPAYHVPSAPGGGVPADLGRPAAQVARVAVEVSNAVLKRHTVVDTPGLDSLTGGGALDRDSLAALASCDALLFVMPHPGQREQESLTALRAAMDGSGLAVRNTLGVLSRIDQLGDGYGDPWPQADRIATRYAARLRGLVSDVIPIAGLLAEAALGDSFTESDAFALQDLAHATSPELRGRILYSPEDFLAEAPVGGEARARLLSLLGLYGIGEALALVDDGARGAVRITRALRARSGIDRLLDTMRTTFTEDADVLRAQSAITALDPVLWSPSTPAEATALSALRATLDRLRRLPALRQSEYATLLAEFHAGRLPLPPPAVQDLIDLATARTDPARVGLPPTAPTSEIPPAADERIRRWRRLESDYRLPLSRAAQSLRETYESIYYHYKTP